MLDNHLDVVSGDAFLRLRGFISSGLIGSSGGGVSLGSGHSSGGGLHLLELLSLTGFSLHVGEFLGLSRHSGVGIVSSELTEADVRGLGGLEKLGGVHDHEVSVSHSEGDSGVTGHLFHADLHEGLHGFRFVDSRFDHFVKY